MLKDKKYIKEVDDMLKKFLESETKYDNNYIIKENMNSIENDICNENNMLYCAIENNSVIGFLYGNIINESTYKESIAHISFVFVEPKYRNNKVATNLINEFLEEIKLKGINIIDVNVFNNNIAANKLYEKLGFNINRKCLRKEII